MSDLHPNLLTYLAAIDAFNRNDLTAVGEYVRPDFRYRIPGRSKSPASFAASTASSRPSHACETSPRGPSR